MWFRVLSLVIAVAMLGKAAIALAAGRRFYAVRERQYATATLTRAVLIAPAVVLTLSVVAWYATIFHYRPWGWIVTGFFTLLSCTAIDHLLRWQTHRQKMLKVVTSPRVWQVDCLLLVVGGAFAALGLLVY